MKIPRPKPPETEFKRKRGPPPQATRLLLSSLAAGLVFMALLAIVFIPRYLQFASPPPSVRLDLRIDTSSGTARIVVANVTPLVPYDGPPLPVGSFNATLVRDNVTVGSLPTGLGNGTTTLSFFDANADGLLDVGDYFSITAHVQGSYRFIVYEVTAGQLAGFLSWEGSLA